MSVALACFKAGLPSPQALERTDRRYLWLRKRLAARTDIWRIFPESWALQQQLCLSFCSITKSQLADILQAKVLPALRAKVLPALRAALHYRGLRGPGPDSGGPLLRRRGTHSLHAAVTVALKRSARLCAAAGECVLLKRLPSHCDISCLLHLQPEADLGRLKLLIGATCCFSLEATVCSDHGHLSFLIGGACRSAGPGAAEPGGVAAAGGELHQRL